MCEDPVIIHNGPESFWDTVLDEHTVLVRQNDSLFTKQCYVTVMDFRRHTRCSRDGSLLGEPKPREQGNNGDKTKQTGFKAQQESTEDKNLAKTIKTQKYRAQGRKNRASWESRKGGMGIHRSEAGVIRVLVL